eukprot:CAMPEP_0119307590 /NCGR_PEP_ID=MMETSP1333-20130426/8046_1 /TAXON_ID=418940 /ORGANISM="Scyphosphaera apsteinii, Strain RCC1455" /LENGTH=284 /DNA_ID=CAMNT_0007311173 /DNA_START=157 /DNA_END=1011 /DNA_ORIENTATION=-
MVARACANFECPVLALVAPAYERNLEEMKSQERRFATQEAGSRVLHDVVEYDSLEAALNGCDAAIGFTRRRGVSRSASANQVEVSEIAKLAAQQSSRRGHVALVFGREADGLRSSELLQCTHSCEIATSAQHGSMNLAAAVTFALGRTFEEALQLEAASAEGPRRQLGADTTSKNARRLGSNRLGSGESASTSSKSLKLASVDEVEYIVRRCVSLAYANDLLNDPQAAADGNDGWVRTARGTRPATVVHGSVAVLRRLLHRARPTGRELRAMHQMLRNLEARNL